MPVITKEILIELIENYASESANAASELAEQSDYINCAAARVTLYAALDELFPAPRPGLQPQEAWPFKKP